MDVLTAVKERRSIKHYDPDFEMTEDEINTLLSAAMLSPTALNTQNWRFVVIRDTELKKKIRAAAWDQAQVTDASLLIALCGDLKAWTKDPGRYWKNAPEDVQELYVNMMGSYFNSAQIERDEAMRSCGMAIATMMLAAKSMGYDSCALTGIDFKEVGRLVHLPDDHVLTMLLVVGKGLKEPWPRPGQLPKDEVIIQNSF